MNKIQQDFPKKPIELFNVYNSKNLSSPIKGIDPQQKYERMRNEYLRERSKSRKNSKKFTSLRSIQKMKAGNKKKFRNQRKASVDRTRQGIFYSHRNERRHFEQNSLTFKTPRPEILNYRDQTPDVAFRSVERINQHLKTETKKIEVEKGDRKTVKKIKIKSAYDFILGEKKKVKKKKKDKKKKKKKKKKKRKKLEKLAKFDSKKFLQKIEKNVDFVLTVLEGIKVRRDLRKQSDHDMTRDRDRGKDRKNRGNDLG